jgi:predicted permease
VRQGLVTLQIAVAVVLVVGAGLFTETFRGLRAVDPGFQARGAVTFRVSLDPQGQGESYVASYYDGLLRELAAIPGVVSAGAAQTLPLNPVGNDFTRPFRPAGDATPSAEAPTVQMRIATPGYFEAMGHRMVAGGPPSGAEEPDDPRVAVVNETLARILWPGADPVGRSFELDFRDGWLPYRVTGVVADARGYGLRAASRPEVFLDHGQSPYLAMSVVLRTDGDPGALVAPARRATAAYGPAQPAHHFVTTEEVLGDAVATERFLLVLMITFGGIALLLACAGVFGMMSHAVGSRTRELGLRMALGADGRQVVLMVVGRAGVIGLVGVIAGLGVALATGRGVRGLLYGVEPGDPLTLAGAGAVLLATALLAALIPARRAASVDPARALRGD